MRYQASSTACDFHASDAKVRLQLGPVRCGKTVSSIMEIMRRAKEQQPSSDGIRYSRWAIFRNTYPELKMTTIKTWVDWFPEYVYGKIKWDSPISQIIKVEDMRLEMFFVSLDNPNDISKLLSMELTGAYFNELQFIPEVIFDAALKRVYQYPPKMMNVPITWGGIIADTNPPDSDHWIFKRFEANKPRNHEIFRYEPAVMKVPDGMDVVVKSEVSVDGTRYIENPAADYSKHIQEPDYYLNGVMSSKDDDISVFFMGQYGALRQNKPVYREYNDGLHCVESMRYAPMVELGMGWDFGRDPSMILVQMMPQGTFNVLDELSGEDMGLAEFAEKFAVPHLNRNYPGWDKNYVAIGDPAGVARDAKDETCFTILRAAGITAQRAKTNNFTPRRESVSYFLRNLVGGRAAFQMSSKCVVLRKGFLDKYHYPKTKINGDDRYKDNPDKNEYSHKHDALQYIAMHYRGDFDTGRNKREVHLGGNIIS